MSRSGASGSFIRSVRRELQYDFGRRRHVDQRCGATHSRRPAERGAPERLREALRRVCRIWRARWWPTARARPRKLTVARYRRARRRAGAHDRPRGRQQQSREDGAVRRGSELGAHHRGGGCGAGRDRSATRGRLSLNGAPWVRRGAIEVLTEAEAHRELEHAIIVVELELGLGECEATAWGCDLSRDYVRINASYRT